jgi:hypothetical protein
MDDEFDQLLPLGQYKLTEDGLYIRKITLTGDFLTFITLPKDELITVIESSLNNPDRVIGTYDPRSGGISNAYILINPALANRLRPLSPQDGGKRKQRKTSKRQQQKKKSNRKSRRARRIL